MGLTHRNGLGALSGFFLVSGGLADYVAVEGWNWLRGPLEAQLEAVAGHDVEIGGNCRALREPVGVP